MYFHSKARSNFRAPGFHKWHLSGGVWVGDGGPQHRADSGSSLNKAVDARPVSHISCSVSFKPQQTAGLRLGVTTRRRVACPGSVELRILGVVHACVLDCPRQALCVLPSLWWRNQKRDGQRGVRTIERGQAETPEVSSPGSPKRFPHWAESEKAHHGAHHACLW